ncbi:MAG: hypothetical protein LBD90_08855 [Bifidobacteriaceae bacterium]|nr:hypothetical protein [Bifidobacteriaceae bacterium]
MPAAPAPAPAAIPTFTPAAPSAAPAAIPTFMPVAAPAPQGWSAPATLGNAGLQSQDFSFLASAGTGQPPGSDPSQPAWARPLLPPASQAALLEAYYAQVASQPARDW